MINIKPVSIPEIIPRNTEIIIELKDIEKEIMQERKEETREDLKQVLSFYNGYKKKQEKAKKKKISLIGKIKKLSFKMFLF